MTTTLEIFDPTDFVQRALQEKRERLVTYEEADDYVNKHGICGGDLLRALNIAYKAGMQDASMLLGLEMDCGI